MNTTDCEKIEDKLAKEFDFSGKFDENNEGSFEEDNVVVGGGGDGCSNAIAGAFDAFEGQLLEKEIILLNSCNNNNNNHNSGSLTSLITTTTIDTGSSQPFPPTLNDKLLLQADEQKSAQVEEQEEEERQHHQLAIPKDSTHDLFCDDVPAEFDDPTHPLSERWSPLGANYDDAISPTSELLSPESELELLSSDSQEKQELSHNDPVELARLRNMEDEQELLTSSLMALTSHFAHVQLRVRQIVEAPSHERDQLLKDLEEFAFRGIPDPLTPAAITTAPKRGSSSLSQHDDEAVRQRQCELIDHLKSQLCELEKLAYESGAPVLPQHVLLEKQKIIIDELKNKLNLKVDEHDLPQLSSEEIKNQVDNAIGEFVGPLRMKEQLVAQLKTQITDLERFIAFLQCDSDDSKMNPLSGSEKFNEAYNSYAAKKKGAAAAGRKQLQDAAAAGAESALQPLSTTSGGEQAAQEGVRESLNIKAHGLIDKASLLMQMFATTHFGTKAEHFQKNTLKKTSKGDHWGDLRAQLEVDIQEVASLAATLSFDREKLANMKRAIKKSAAVSGTSVQAPTNSAGPLTKLVGAHRRPPSGSRHNELKPYTLSSDSDDDVTNYDCYDWEQHTRRMAQSARFRGDSINTICRELTTAVRKNFAITLQRLIQHGLRVETESATSSLIVPFMRCLNPSPVFAARDAAATSFLASSSSSAPYGTSLYDDNYDEDGSSSSFFGSGGSRPMHAWELILEYYYLKHGDEYNNTPARKLSESFKLDIVESHAVTAKQSLLSTVGMIIAMHRPYKRSYNAHFKAFVCAALNSHQLVEWLNLIFSCSDLIDMYYTPNSYVVRTGFRDSLRSIDALSKYDFDLPVDLAIRHFRNI